MRSLQKRVDEIMKWPWRNEYRITEIPEEEGGGIEINVPLLGANICIGAGDTFDEAENNLLGAMQVAIEEHLETGREVPRPRTRSSFSGTFIVRTSPDTHERLVREAERQGTSMNYLVGVFLERSLSGSDMLKAMQHIVQVQEISWTVSEHHCHMRPEIKHNQQIESGMSMELQPGHFFNNVIGQKKQGVA